MGPHYAQRRQSLGQPTQCLQPAKHCHPIKGSSLKALEHHIIIVPRDLRGVLNWAPPLYREASEYGSQLQNRINFRIFFLASDMVLSFRICFFSYLHYKNNINQAVTKRANQCIMDVSSGVTAQRNCTTVLSITYSCSYYIYLYITYNHIRITDRIQNHIRI